MRTEQAELIRNVTRTRRCDWCGQLKPLEQFGQKKSDPEGHNKTCAICCQRRQIAYKWRRSQKYLPIRGQTYRAVQWLLGLRGERLCQLCYSILPVKVFSDDRPQECPDCYDKWWPKKVGTGADEEILKEFQALKELVLEMAKGIKTTQ